MDLYGNAVFRERALPARYAELAYQLGREFGPGTGIGYFLAEVAAAAGPRRRSASRRIRRALRALADAVRAAMNGGRRSPEAVSAEEASASALRRWLQGDDDALEEWLSGGADARRPDPSPVGH